MTKVRSARGGIPNFRKIACRGSLPFIGLQKAVVDAFHSDTYYCLVSVPDGMWVRANYRGGELRDVQLKSTSMGTNVVAAADYVGHLPKKIKWLSDCSIVGVVIEKQREPSDLQPGRSAVDNLDRKKYICDVLTGAVKPIAGQEPLNFVYLYNDTEAALEKPCYVTLSREYEAATRDGFCCAVLNKLKISLSHLMRTNNTRRLLVADYVGEVTDVIFDIATEIDYPLMGILYLPDSQMQRYSNKYRANRDQLTFIQTLC